MPTALSVQPSRRALRGSVPVAADPDILERALLFAALARGTSTLRVPHPPASLDLALEALSALGVLSHRESGSVQVEGRGLRGLLAPGQAVDVGGAPVLGQGLLACLSVQPFTSELGPFAAVERLANDAEVLRRAGVGAEANGHQCRLGPLSMSPRGQTFQLEAPSALGKLMLLTLGLYASGPTQVSEPMISADHTERMLQSLGVSIDCVGSIVRMTPPVADALPSFEFDAPGSPAAAAYLLAAGALVRGSHVVVRQVVLNPTRAGFIDGLLAFGARVGMTPKQQTLNEPCGDVSLEQRPLSAGRLGGELSLRLDHEIYALAAVAACARGQSRFSDLGSLLSEEAVSKLIGFLRSFGVKAESAPDGFLVEGRDGKALSATKLTTGGDPHLGAMGVLLALAADGESVIDDVDSLAEFLPRFVGTLRALGAELKVVQ